MSPITSLSKSGRRIGAYIKIPLGVWNANALLLIAAEQEAKLWELRATASLARLRRDQGRHAEARDLLAPVYGWFTEGFDTADLEEAKALLDELA